MSYSKLVDYVKLTNNCNKPRKYPISVITIHHMAGNLSVETCGEVFSRPTRQASSNYAVGTDGRIACYVEEENRAWTSSSAENDHKAITIEVANDQIGGNWHVSDLAIARTIELCVDICQRNKIEKLNFTGDKTGNVTLHKWFAATLCPGPYLESKIPYIVEEVNKKLQEDKEQEELIKDNKPNKWAESAVDFALDNDIIKGDNHGDLKLHDECTREDVIVFLYRYYNSL